MRPAGLLAHQRVFEIERTVAWLCLVWLLSSAAPICARPASRTPPSLDEWRRLTGPAAEPPRIFVKGHKIHFYLQNGAGLEAFSAKWRRVRVPVENYSVNSAILQWDGRLPRLPAAEHGWREARVITGADWHRLATKLVAELTPRTPGHAASFQALFTDVVLFRDLQGRPQLATLDNYPDDLIMEHRFSAEESLDHLARLVHQHLAQSYPDELLFLVIAPDSGRVTQPLLLDRQHRRCVSLSPAALYGFSERGLSLAVTTQALSALLLESHGLALLKNPISSIGRLGNFTLETVTQFVRLPLPHAGKGIPPVTQAKGMDLAAWEGWLDHHTGTRREQGSLRLLIDGDRFFPRLRQAIAAATNHIHFQIYIFDTDDVGADIADQLRQRSSQVQVKVSMDRLMSIAAGFTAPATPMPTNFVPPPSMLAYLRKDSQVQVRPFLNPWLSADHSKVLLVDGTHAWLGGMNFGREYRYEWHDLMVELEGPIVASFEDRFRCDWAHAGLFGDLAYAAALLRRSAHGQSVPRTAAACDIRRLPTTTTSKPFATAVLGALERAQSYVYLENPYLFDRRVIAALVRARLRGVDVRIVLPRPNDFGVRARTNVMIANYLLQQGVRVFFYPSMTHVKALLVDDWACLGSANLDHLSLSLNQEQNIASADTAFTASLKYELFDTDFARSCELTKPLQTGCLDFLATLVLESF